MDPTETIVSLLAAIGDRDADYVREHADALAEWIERGGFVPIPEIQRHARKVVVTISATPRGGDGHRG